MQRKDGNFSFLCVVLFLSICIILASAPALTSVAESLNEPILIDQISWGFLGALKKSEYEKAAALTTSQWQNDISQGNHTPAQELERIYSAYAFDFWDFVEDSYTKSPQGEQVYLVTERLEKSGYQIYLHAVPLSREKGEYRVDPHFLENGLAYPDEIESRELRALVESTSIYYYSLPENILNSFLGIWENGMPGDGEVFVSDDWQSKHPNSGQDQWLFFNLDDYSIEKSANQSYATDQVFFTVTLRGEGNIYTRDLLMHQKNFIWYIMLDGIDDLFLEDAYRRQRLPD